MNLYIAYGLGIKSEIFLPELLKEEASADVEIRKGKLDTFLRQVTSTGEGFWATESEAYRIYPDVGSFLVRNGREIIIDPDPGADERLLRLYLLGRIFGALLHQRGLLVLHGSAVALGGGAAAFLGYSGSGKSTAAASLSVKGYSMVADDLVVIDAMGAVPLVYPAFPQLKIWPEVAESLGYDLGKLPYISPKETKRAAYLTANFSTDPLPLKRIYLLEKGESIEIRQLEPHESMIELVRNSYAVQSLNAKANLPSHFSQCAKVAKDVSICRVVRPFDLESLPKFVCVIEDDVRRG